MIAQWLKNENFIAIIYNLKVLELVDRPYATGMTFVIQLNWGNTNKARLSLRSIMICSIQSKSPQEFHQLNPKRFIR